MVTARSWTRPSTKSWKSRSLRKSNEPERSEFRVPSSEFAKGSLPHDRGLSWRGKDHLRGQTRRKADEARAARRPDHERPGERTGRYSDVALARVRYGRNSGRLFLLPVQFARAEIFEVSARSGARLGSWFDRITAAEQTARATMEVDYELYAVGEALLGWLNCTVRLEDRKAFDANAVLERLAGAIQERLRS